MATNPGLERIAKQKIQLIDEEGSEHIEETDLTHVLLSAIYLEIRNGNGRRGWKQAALPVAERAGPWAIVIPLLVWALNSGG